MSRWYFLFLLFEVLVSVAVVFVFRSLENRFHAGMVAGSLFILLGIAIVGFGLVKSAFRKSITFKLGCVHLFLVALPMVMFRLWNSDLEFGQVRVWGLPGPVFHKASELLYLLLMASSLIEGIRTWRRDRKTAAPVA